MTLKSLIVLCVLFFSLLGFPTKDNAQELEIIPPPVTIVNPVSLSVEQQVEYFSTLYGADVSLNKAIIRCESQFNPQAHNSCGENSWGLVQINLDAHPDITKEQATDIAFSVKFLSDNINNGNGGIWTSYRAIQNGGSYTFWSKKLNRSVSVYCKI